MKGIVSRGAGFTLLRSILITEPCSYADSFQTDPVAIPPLTDFDLKRLWMV